jgi:hypothetical protein
MSLHIALASDTPSGPSDGVRTAPSYTLDAPLAGTTSPSGAARALLVFTLSVGTGGYVTSALAMAQTKSSSPALEWPTGALDADGDIATTSPSEQVMLIRRWLSLNVADTARVLQVQRPTIYAWTSGAAFPSQEHRQRIATVFKLAALWRERSAEPVGQRLRQPVIAGRSLFELLSDATIDPAAIARAVRLLTESSTTEQPRSAADIAKAHGFPARPERQQRRAIEHETRFRRPAR